MKKSILKAFAFLALMAVFALPTKLGAQTSVCPYLIYNGTGCSITVDYQLYSNGNPCGLVTGNVITAGNSLTLTCNDLYNCGPPWWDIEVTITDYAGTTVISPQTVNAANPGPLSWGPCAGSVPAFCCANSQFLIIWGTTAVKIY